MRGIVILVAAAAAWAWLAGSAGPAGPEAPADVASGPPAAAPDFFVGWHSFWSERPPAPPPNPLVPCRLPDGEETYLRRAECERRGRVLTEPAWARLDPPLDPL